MVLRDHEKSHVNAENVQSLIGNHVFCVTLSFGLDIHKLFFLQALE